MLTGINVEIVIGMMIAFILGAYIRQPFALKKNVSEPKQEMDVDEEMKRFMEQESENEQKRQMQMFKALYWNGEKGDTLNDE